MARSILIILICVAIFCCSTTTEPTGDFELTVIVQDKYGNLIEDAEICFTNKAYYDRTSENSQVEQKSKSLRPSGSIWLPEDFVGYPVKHEITNLYKEKIVEKRFNCNGYRYNLSIPLELCGTFLWVDYKKLSHDDDETILDVHSLRYYFPTYFKFSTGDNGKFITRNKLYFMNFFDPPSFKIGPFPDEGIIEFELGDETVCEARYFDGEKELKGKKVFVAKSNKQTITITLSEES